MKQEKFEQYGAIKPFDVSISYAEIDSNSPENTHDAHVHAECEIYINLSGDVSFMVENNIYPVAPGSIIITSPCEYHHCIYHSNHLHKHFWILFSSAGNERLFDIFYKRKKGENNLLMLSHDKTEALILLCHQMIDGSASEAEAYFRFFKLISLLNDADMITSVNGMYPKDVIYAMNYIDAHLSQHISIAEVANKAHVSMNTLERHFFNVLNISPSSYIKKKRLANAVKLLLQGSSVTEASEKSGFPDYSNFIALFKRTYGITPHKYKKALADNRNESGGIK